MALQGGTGAYSNSQGVPAIRQHVADFIQARDGYASSADNIFLTNGASTGELIVAFVLREKYPCEKNNTRLCERKHMRHCDVEQSMRH